MKCYIVETPGGPFQVREAPTSQPGSHEVLVKIVSSGVNPLDTKIRAGQAAHAKQPLPAVLGMDMSGTVVATGSNVAAFQPGDDVFGMVGGVGGLQGTLAEYISADAALLARKPRTLTMQQAAALPLVAITAWEGLVDHAQVRPGQKVLIHAGAGGVGYAAIQLALARGAQVFTTVSADKRDVVEALGVTAILRDEPPTDYIAKHTNGEGFDIIYDTLGGHVLDDSFLAAKRYVGHVVSCLGWGSHSLAALSFRAATYSGVFTLMPLLSGKGREKHGQILREVAELAERGLMKPFLSEQRFTAEQSARAYDYVAQGSRGKVVIDL